MAKKKNGDFTNDFLNDIIKKSGNEYATIMNEETLSTTTDWVDTSSKALNGLICGDIDKGIPNNKVIAFAGPEQSGKTYLVLSIAKRAIKDGYVVLYFDSENSTEKETLEKRNIDPTKMSYFPVDTVEDFRDQMVKILNEYNDRKEKPKLMVILDSLGNLSTRKEIRDVETGNDKADMTRAKVIKSVFRVLNRKLALAKIPMIITNHVYDSVGSFIPQKVLSGGSGLKYSASTIIFLSRKKVKDKKDTKKVNGYIFTCKTAKNRFCKPESSVQIYLSFKRGLHPYYGLQDFAEPMIKKLSRGWEYNGEKITEKKLFNMKWDNDIMEKIRTNVLNEISFNTENEDDYFLGDTEKNDTEENTN